VSEHSQNNETIFQQTLKNPIRCTGIGLHSGSKVSMTLKPSDVDTGIRFVRTDQPADRAEVRATWDRVTDTKLCTVISNDAGVSIGTIEHLMAALRGCGIDNAVIELDGPEVPIMDGSSAPFVFLIECAGVAQQDKPRRLIQVLRKVTVGDAGRYASLTPSGIIGFSFEIDFAAQAIARQEGYVKLGKGAFKAELARARTFGFLHEVDQMRKLGLARGGSLDNAIVINGDKVLNEGGLRFTDEFVRHKILDSVGDLYLAGAPILGHFHGCRSGHALNNQLLRALFADEKAWCYTDAEAADVIPASWPLREKIAAVA
jgi:UDP-3-O-[3-hydroxymyristoyl] N-acetylglucosamine deacetylase